MRFIKTTLAMAFFVSNISYAATATPQGNNDNIKSPSSGADYYWNDALTGIYISGIDMSASAGFSGGQYWVKILDSNPTYSAITTAIASGTIDLTVDDSSIDGLGLSGGEVFYVIVIRENSTETVKDTANIQSYEYRNVSASDASASNAPALQSTYDKGPSSSDGYTNLTSLVFDITGATVGEHVKLWDYYNNNYLDEEENTATSSLTLAGSFSTGDFSVRTETINQYGMQAFSGFDNVYIDQTAPTAPSVVADDPDNYGEWNLLASSDSGELDNDRLTNDNTPSIAIYHNDLAVNPTGNVGTSYGRAVIYLDGAATDSSDGDGDDYLVITMSEIADGTYTVTSEIVDPGGNRSGQSSGFTLTIDTAADASGVTPDLSTDETVDTGFSQSDHYTSDTTPTFVMTGSGATGVQAGDSIIVKSGSTWIAGGWASSDGTITVTVPDANALTAGTYTSIAAFVVDSAGNTSSASSFLSPNLVIDTQKPSTPSAPTLKSGFDTGMKSDDNLTNRKSAIFTLAAESTDDSVYLYIDGSKNNSKLAGATSGIELAVSTALLDASYSITYTDVDKAGNESDASAALAIEIDSTKPNPPTTITMFSADDSGHSNSDMITKNRQPRFTVAPVTQSVTDKDSLTLYFSSNAVDGLIVSSASETMQPEALISTGNYALWASAMDSAGNVSDSSGVDTVKIDVDDPAAPTNAPDLVSTWDSGKLDNDDLTKDTTVTFLVKVVLPGDSIFVLFGTDTAGRDQVQSGADSVLVTASDQASGTYSVTALAIDPAGNRGSASAVLSFEIDTTAPTIPSNLALVTDPGISNSDGITNDPTPDIQLTADNNDSVDVYFASSIKAQGPIVSGNTVTLTPAAEIANGGYSVTAKAIDLAGNVSNTSTSIRVKIDTVTPGAPTITGILSTDDSGFKSNDNYTNVQNPSIIVTSLDDDELDSIRVFYLSNGVVVDSVAANFDTDTLKAESNLPGGSYILRAVAIDSAGNQSDTTASGNRKRLVIDLTDPSAITGADLKSASDTGSDSTDDYTKDLTPEFTISSTGGFVTDSVFIILEKGAYRDTLGQEFAESGTTRDITVNAIDTSSSAFDNGDIEVYAYAVDSAGNVTSSAALMTFTLDTRAPTAPLITLRAQDDSGVLDDDNLTNIVNPRFNIWNGSTTDSVFIVAGTDTVGRDITDSDPDIIQSDSTAAGTYIYTALLEDKAGNMSAASTSITVRIDTSAPTTPNAPDLLTSSDKGFSDTDNITNVSQPYFELTSVSPDDPGKIDSVFILQDSSGTTLASSWTSQLNKDTLQVSALIHGTYAAPVVFAMDSAGNISDTSAAMDPPLRIDLLDPSKPSTPDLITASDFGMSDTDNNTRELSPTFRTTNLEAGTFLKLFSINGENDTTTVVSTVVPADSTGQSLTPTNPLTADTLTFFVVSEDTAGNTIESDDLGNVILDGAAEICSLFYVNTDSTHLTNLGKSGNTIQLTAKFKEKTGTNPEPYLHVQYADSTTDSFRDLAGTSSNSDSTWTYSFVLPSGTENDGILTATFTAYDIGGNQITSIFDTTVFVVDNTPPAAFTVGSITNRGYNQVPGWINGKTDSLEIVIPIDQTDASLLKGDVYIQMRIPLRMPASQWLDIGVKDSIETSADSIFTRITSTIVTKLAGEGFVQGDSVVTRAIIHDEAGNSTTGSESGSKFVYDPNKMTIGANSITGGNTLNVDTLFSNDTLSIQWDDFDEVTPATASGLDRYEMAVEHIGDDSITQFVNWAGSGTTASKDTILALRHDNQYKLYIRAIDVAGNVSDTLSSGTFRRYNTAPVLTVVDSSIAYEDVLWKDTLTVTDPDLATLLSDTMNYFKIRTVGITGSVSADSMRVTALGIDSAVISWTPLQADSGSYTITAWVKDVWEPDTFIDSVSFYIYVQAVNDTPVVVITDPARQITFEEDDQDTVRYNMTSYATDADNDSTQLSWNPVLGASAGITGFPKERPPTIIFGPNTSEIAKQNIRRKYGVEETNNPAEGGIGYLLAADSSVQVQVTIDTSGGNTYATFDADSNYYITDYPVIFEVSDPAGALASDTTYLTITPKNDAPQFNTGQTTLGDTIVTENDSILIDLGSFVTDVDDSLLYFHVAALSYKGKMSISDTSYSVDSVGYYIKFEPQKLWSDSSLIRVVVRDREDITSSNAKSDTVVFTIDVIRVPRPNLFLSVVQNNAFTNFYDIFVTDTMMKTVRCSVEVQGIPIALDTVASYTYAGNYYFTSPGVYIFDVMAKGVVGDTSITNGVSLALAQSARMWTGSSTDGRFRVRGEPGSVTTDRLLLISDSTLFGPYFEDRASYLLGNEYFYFSEPVEISFPVTNENQAIYRRINGSKWQELPSVSENGLVWAWTEKMGYFKLGMKTIFVPEMTGIHHNFPNPFNPVTTIEYDLGIYEGPRQKVSLAVVNLLGQHVKTLVNEKKEIGRHTVHWYGRNETGESMASGIYFVRMMTDRGIVKTRKITLIR